MTIDYWNRLDERIAALEALGDARTADQTDQLAYLRATRTLKHRRLADAWRRTRAKLAAIEAYARQHSLPLGEAA